MKRNDLINVLLIIGIVFTFFSFFQSYTYYNSSINIELYNRHFSSLLAANRFDPYFFKWEDDFSMKFLDPYSLKDFPINRVIATPFEILLNYPFANLKYQTVKMLWFFLEWVFMFLSIFFGYLAIKDKRDKKLFLSLILIIFPISYFWMVHIIKGSFFIVFIFFTLLSIYLYEKGLKSLSLFTFGMFSLLYIPSLIFSLILLFSKRFKAFLYYIAGLLTSFFVPLFFIKQDIWHSFFKMMKYRIDNNISFQIPLKMNFNIKQFSELTDRLFFYNSVKIFDLNVKSIFEDFFNIVIPFYILGVIILILIVSSVFFIRKIKNFRTLFLFSLFYFYAIALFQPFPVYLFHNLLLIPVIMLFFNCCMGFKNAKI